MGNEVIAEELFASTAVEAVSAQLGVVCHNTISNCETLNRAAKRCDYTHRLMAGNKRKLPFVVNNKSRDQEQRRDLPEPQIHHRGCVDLFHTHQRPSL